MIKGLNSVDWEKLGIPEVPALIEGASAASTFSEAEDALDLLIRFGNKTSKQKYYIAVFLIHLLTYRRLRDWHKFHILVLLVDCGFYKRSDWWERRAYKRFCDNAPFYLSLIESSNDQVVDGMFYFMWFFKYRLPKKVVPIYWKLLEERRYPGHEIVWNLGKLIFETKNFSSKTKRQYVEFLERIINDENENLAIRRAAASWLIEVLKDKAPAKAFQIRKKMSRRIII
jgi:hypothetical protein